jgi:hypothetical protein
MLPLELLCQATQWVLTEAGRSLESKFLAKKRSQGNWFIGSIQKTRLICIFIANFVGVEYGRDMRKCIVFEPLEKMYQ